MLQQSICTVATTQKALVLCVEASFLKLVVVLLVLFVYCYYYV